MACLTWLTASQTSPNRITNNPVPSYPEQDNLDLGNLEPATMMIIIRDRPGLHRCSPAPRTRSGSD
jgi:hypothetical protein